MLVSPFPKLVVYTIFPNLIVSNIIIQLRESQALSSFFFENRQRIFKEIGRIEKIGSFRSFCSTGDHFLKQKRRSSDDQPTTYRRRKPKEEIYVADEEVKVQKRKLIITAKTDKQKEALRKINENDIIFLIGPAGTGKTFLAVMKAIEEIMNGTVNRIILTRPVVESGEHLGFLPGGPDEKLSPYMRPLFEHLKTVFKADEFEDHMQGKVIEVIPLAYMRGSTMRDAFVILDESQNLSDDQLKMALTRIGENSKIVITADPDQTDLPRENNLIEIATKLSKLDRIDYVTFGEEDSVRHPMIKSILKVFREIKENQKC
jgi:phosphate starvation-inducible PhoH-like protein